MLDKVKLPVVFYYLLIFTLVPGYAWGMHIADGFLPLNQSFFWMFVTVPFIWRGLRSIQVLTRDNPNIKLLLGLAGAFVFVLSALKMPSFTGSSSHATGIGLGTIMFGPAVMSVLGLIVLIFQALLLGHGGLSTLGANTFSMCIVGSLVSWTTYRMMRKLGLSLSFTVFLSCALGNISTYIMAAIQMAWAVPDITGGFTVALMKFMAIYALTQIPLAISEGILTVMVFNGIKEVSKAEMEHLAILPGEVQSDAI